MEDKLGIMYGGKLVPHHIVVRWIYGSNQEFALADLAIPGDSKLHQESISGLAKETAEFDERMSALDSRIHNNCYVSTISFQVISTDARIPSVYPINDDDLRRFAEYYKKNKGMPNNRF